MTQEGSKKQYDAEVLLGELDQLLSVQYINVASIGAMTVKGDSRSHTAMAMAHAKGHGFSSADSKLARICHDELVRHIRSGLDLNAALRAARHTEPSKSAFNQFQESNLDRMLADMKDGAA